MQIKVYTVVMRTTTLLFPDSSRLQEVPQPQGNHIAFMA